MLFLFCICINVNPCNHYADHFYRTLTVEEAKDVWAAVEASLRRGYVGMGQIQAVARPLLL